MSVAKVHTNTSANIASAGATQAVTIPTGSGSGEIAILAVGCGRFAAAAGSYTAPAAWTQIGGIFDANNGNNHVSGQVFWALGSTAGASLTLTKSGSVDTMGWVCVTFSGVDLTTPVDATGTANSGTGATTLTTNAVTVTAQGDQGWHLIGFFDWFGNTVTAPSFTVAPNGLTNESANLLYNTTPKSPGSTGTVIITGTTAGGQVMIGIPFVLRPASATADQPYDLQHRPQHQAVLAM